MNAMPTFDVPLTARDWLDACAEYWTSGEASPARGCILRWEGDPHSGEYTAFTVYVKGRAVARVSLEAV